MDTNAVLLRNLHGGDAFLFQASEDLLLHVEGDAVGSTHSLGEGTMYKVCPRYGGHAIPIVDQFQTADWTILVEYPELVLQG